MKRHPIVILIIIMGFCLFHCGKRAMLRKYYVLETQKINQRITGVPIQPLAGNADVRDFRVTKAFEQTRIAVRTESHELNYYYYHHWAARPSSVIPDMICPLVDRAGLFHHCVRGFTNNPEFLIIGQVETIERIQKKNSVSAHISAILELIEEKTSIPLVRHDFDLTVELKDDKSMNAFASAISHLLEQETNTFIIRMINYFQKRNQSIGDTENDPVSEQ
jgi:ABC-type uncharacterized transport system auxiliary subunit